jgi:hypothetical protein
MLVVEPDDGQGLDLGVFAKTDVARRVVDETGATIIRVGLMRISLLGKDLYLWMVPGPGLAPIRARELRALWRQALGDRTVLVLISENNKKAARWAEFFGFTYQRSYKGDAVYGICGSSA